MVGLLFPMLFFFLVYQFLWGPLLDRRAAVLAEARQVRSELAAARAARDALPVEKVRSEQARQRYEAAREGFRADMSDGGALVRLGLEAARLGIRLTGYHAMKLVETEQYLALPAVLEMQGPYPALTAFLEGIENRRIIGNVAEVRQLTLQQASGNQIPGAEEVKGKTLLLFYSEVSPEARLAMAEMAAWKLGREDAFAQARVVSPYPGVEPQGVFGPPPGATTTPGIASGPPPGGAATSHLSSGPLGETAVNTGPGGSNSLPGDHLPAGSPGASSAGESGSLPPGRTVTTPSEPVPPDPRLPG